jgi:hypothetical protein
LDIHASRFQPPASDSAPKTQDTSGRLSQPELLQCDQVSVSLKTSRDISALGFPTCCKTWQEWVTERRGAWRQRVNAARLTSESESLCSLWPTPEGMAGGKTCRGGNRKDELLLNGMVKLHGQAVPASSSSLGSRQGLWPTVSVPNGGQTTSGRADKDTKKQVRLEHAVAQWMAPRACEAQNPPMGVDKRHHGLTHQVTKQWLTPKVPSGGGQATRTTDGGGLRKLEDQTEARATGKLNPRWVETLMGLPIGWTMPSCTSPQTIAPMSCDSSAMELSPPPQSELSES